MTPKQIEKRIEGIKIKLSKIGGMRPGSLSQQYSVCASKGCHCKDPENPKKHGPYNQLSYVRNGKSTTRFIRPHQLKAVKSQLAQYKRFRMLVEEWLKLAIEQAEADLQTTRDNASSKVKRSAKEK
jgi:hypothetical protein